MAKRILNGTAYNTATATVIGKAVRGSDAHWSEQSLSDMGYEMLYQTRKGAYFIVKGSDFYPEQAEIHPITPENAAKWVKNNANNTDLSSVDTPESRYTLRLPTPLKQKIDEAATASGQSTNAWVVRTLERALKTSH